MTFTRELPDGTRMVDGEPVYERTTIALPGAADVLAIDHGLPLTDQTRGKIMAAALALYDVLLLEGFKIRLAQLGPAANIADQDASCQRIREHQKQRARHERLSDRIPTPIRLKLSPRECEVLLLLEAHQGTDDIARQLFVSDHTVRSHVKSLLRKLDVSSRREALHLLAGERERAAA